MLFKISNLLIGENDKDLTVSSIAEFDDESNVIDFLESMSSVFKPIGATNFQFLVIDGKIRLLEINPRISSSTSIR